MRRLLWALVALALAVLAGAFVLTAPRPLAEDALAGLAPDVANGALVFAAAGCASCHTPPLADGAPEPEGPPILAGGKRFATAFGTFVAPNITPDPDAGIGGWSDLEIASAIQTGVSPEGAHYFPAFPYTAYARAERQDILDLVAYLRTLPADPTPSAPHEVGFPFNIRASVGGWKALYSGPDWIVTGDLSPEALRGRYLAEALAHCGECHTPRNALGGLDLSRWLQGAPNPGGEGRIPGITASQLAWSEADIAAYLRSGFTPEFDVAGGEMADVIRNLATLPESDTAAIAAYIKAVPPAPVSN